MLYRHFEDKHWIFYLRDEDTLDEGSDDDFFNEDHKTVDTVIEGVNKQIKEEAEKALEENGGKHYCCQW